MAVPTSLTDPRGQQAGVKSSPLSDRAGLAGEASAAGASGGDRPVAALEGSRTAVADPQDSPGGHDASSTANVDRVRSINHHLRLAIEQVGEGVIIVEAEAGRDVGPRIVFSNRAAGVLTGRKADTLVGEHLGVIYDPQELEHLVSRLPSVALTDKTYQMEKGAVLQDGSLKPFRWSIRSVRDERGQTVNFLLTLRPTPDEDAGEAKAGGAAAASPVTGQEDAEGEEPTPEAHAERELQASIEKSRIESLAQLAGGIAHDFNNVLTSIFSNLSLAKLASASGSEVRRHVEDALEASQNAQSLAQQILDFTKGRSQSVELVDMSKVVKQAAKLSMMGSRIRCDVTVDEDVWGVEADLGQVRQVVHNFLINAAQAMPRGGVVQAQVINTVVDDENPVGDLPPGAYVKIAVRDRGCGISKENLKRIFDPYFTTKETGSGIGLATCRTIVQRHRGTIAVQSKLKVGSEFSLFLPACLIEEETGPINPNPGGAGGTPEPEPEPEGRNEAGGGVSGVISGQGRVLVVDDQDDVRISAERLLERLGYHTVSASDGQEAVRKYRDHWQSEEPISAVLLDMTLPGGLSGDEVMEEIRKFDNEARVIATSGWFDEDAEERFLIDGYIGILPKPYAVESLSQKLHEAVTRN